MASTSETGHAKNVANFEDLISYCTGYGPTYNPSKVAIKLPGLSTLLTNATASLQAVKVAKTAYDNATNAREISFKPLKPLATKIINALSATGAPQQTIDDAKTINLKIQGKRAKAIKEPAPTPAGTATPTVKTASASQQSYDKLIDHFAQLIQLLTAAPTYIPNENELKVATLNTMITDLKAKNTAVINATTAISNARIARDTVLYAAGLGLVDTSKAVKQYVKSIFSASSPQYKQVSKLEFKTIKGD